MKIAILAAGTSKYFPLFIDKPKCLYHTNGKVQLQRVIETAKAFVPEKDIIVVAGYKSNMIKEFLKAYPEVTLKINERYNEPAIYSFITAVNGENDDFVFMFGDENILPKNVERIVKSNRKLAILCHDSYYYYSLGIFKLRKDCLNIIHDEKYLSMDAMKEIYCFSNSKTIYDGTFNINSGICIGYTLIDFVRRIGNIKRIENPMTSYHGDDIDFLHYDPDTEYIPDIDHIYDTDEYKNSLALKVYCKLFSNPLKKVIGMIKHE